MSFKQKFTIILAAVAFVANTAFAAGMPGNIKSIQAVTTGSGLTVSWAPVADAVFYRVYYSQQSILGNGGNYDDFERTTGSETVYTFTSVPVSAPRIFVGVLAVNAEGMESEGFEVEASGETPAIPNLGGQSSSASSEPIHQETMIPPSNQNIGTTAIPMEIKAIATTSATGVLITFSKDIRPGASINPGFFLIVNTGGVVLPIMDVRINGATIELTTKPQTSETMYLLSLVRTIPAADGTSVTASSPRAQFVSTKHEGIVSAPATPEIFDPSLPVQNQAGGNDGYGRNPAFTPPGNTQPGYGRPPMGLPGPAIVDLQATPQKDGTYTVFARWVPSQNALSYVLYTSPDGQQYTRNAVVGGQETSVQYNHVRPGTFGLRITANDTAGNESAAMERTISLPASGIGILGIMAAAGAAAGRKIMRRKKSVLR